MPVNLDVIRPLLSKNRKRKADSTVDSARLSAAGHHLRPDDKMPRSSVTSPYLIPELPYVISVCDDRIPFIALQEELNKHGIRHQVGAGSYVDNLVTTAVYMMSILTERYHVDR